MSLRSLSSLASLACVASLAQGAVDSISALEKAARPAAGIMDNSFLIEEAYNQEPGVVQHIWNVAHTVSRHAGPDERALSFVFTQEWPVFTQAHQFSYTLPFTFLESEGRGARGLEDISLSYRFQFSMETEDRPAFAPSFSLILPTGDEAKGLGARSLGYRVNLPVSKIVSARWTMHGNAGATFFPDVKGHDLTGYNLGVSAVYAVGRNFNFLLEAVVDFEEGLNDFGRRERAVAAVLSPGFRYAINHAHDAQTVLGLAVPIGVTSDAPDFGVFLYVSFEHFFYRPKSSEILGR